MATNGLPEGIVAVGDALRDLVPQIRQTLEQGEAHEQSLRELADKQRAENARIRRALSVIDPDYAPAPTTKKRKASVVRRPNATGRGISVERAAQYADKIIEMADEGDGFVTQKDVYKALDSVGPS